MPRRPPVTRARGAAAESESVTRAFSGIAGKGPSAGRRAVVQVSALRRDVVGDVLRVVPDAPDEARSAPREPRQADEVDAGLARQAAPLPRPAALVERVDLQPAVVDPEAGGPDDRRDARPGEVEL